MYRFGPELLWQSADITNDFEVLFLQYQRTYYRVFFSKHKMEDTINDTVYLHTQSEKGFRGINTVMMSRIKKCMALSSTWYHPGCQIFYGKISKGFCRSHGVVEPFRVDDVLMLKD